MAEYTEDVPCVVIIPTQEQADAFPVPDKTPVTNQVPSFTLGRVVKVTVEPDVGEPKTPDKLLKLCEVIASVVTVSAVRAPAVKTPVDEKTNQPKLPD